MKWLFDSCQIFEWRGLRQVAPTGKFVVLCRARTGSYLLADLLSQFEDIQCLGEIFKKRSLELPKDVRRKLGMTLRQRDRFPLTYMHRVFGLLGTPIVGFKLFPSHNRFMLKYLCEAVEFKKVVLQRNPVDSYISVKHAIATDQWRKKKLDNREISSETFNFDKAEFDRYVVAGDKYFDLIRQYENYTGQKFCWVDYELVKDIEPVRDVARFLGSSGRSSPLRPASTKQITRPKSEIVGNYEEMTSYLKLRYPKLISPAHADKP